MSTMSTPLMMIPGKKHHHGVTVTDDLGQPVDPSFSVAMDRVTENVKLDSTFVCKKIQLKGEPGENATLYLQTMLPRQSYIKLDVKLTDCPPGFMLNDVSECVCNADVGSSVKSSGYFSEFGYKTSVIPSQT